MKLKVKDISKNYNRYSALRGVNLELEPGLYGLLGPNGAGKSTLLKIIAGILRPTAGSILLDNEPVSKLGSTIVPCWAICRKTWEFTLSLPRNDICFILPL